MREFQKDALLRIDDFGFQRTDAKERGVEQVGAFNQAASANVVRIIAETLVDARAQVLPA